MNLKNTLQARDDIERSVLSNIMLFCTQLTFDLILSHRDIYRIGIHPYRFNYTYWNIFSKDASFYPILPSEVFFVIWTANYLVKSVTIRESNHGSRVRKEHYV